MELKELQSKLISFNDDSNCQRLAEIYGRKSILEILSITRTEMQHSSFLSWLFEGKDIECAANNKPIIRLLDLIYRRANEQGKSFVAQLGATSSNVLERALLTRNVEFLNLKAHKEVPLSCGRPDFVITADVRTDKQKARPLTIVVENKVLACEGENQTKKYKVYYQNEYQSNGQHDYIFVYLTPIQKDLLDDFNKLPGSQTCSCPDFIHICYQDILDDVIAPLLENNEISERTKFVLNEYVDSLGYPSKDEKTQKRTIMALRGQELDMLKSFWSEYADLVLETILNHYNSAYKTTPEVRNYLSAFWNSNEILLYAVVNALSEICRDDWKLSLAKDIIDYDVKSNKSDMYFVSGCGKLLNKKDLAIEILKFFAKENGALDVCQLNDFFHKHKGCPNNPYSSAKSGKYSIQEGTVYIVDDANLSHQSDAMLKAIQSAPSQKSLFDAQVFKI